MGRKAIGPINLIRPIAVGVTAFELVQLPALRTTAFELVQMPAL